MSRFLALQILPSIVEMELSSFRERNKSHRQRLSLHLEYLKGLGSGTLFETENQRRLFMVLERRRPARGLIPWQPFRDLEAMSRHLEDMFLPVWKRLPIEEKEWLPAIEVFEKDDRFVVKAELPGMKEEDIDVSISDDTLTIKGERKSENEVKEENYYCRERSYGSFHRSIALPSNVVDGKKIEASYEDGVLEVNIPKATEAKPKKIAVSTKKKEKSS